MQIADVSVKEYWVVFPEQEIVKQYIHKDGKFIYYIPIAMGDTLTYFELPEFRLRLNKFFQNVNKSIVLKCICLIEIFKLFKNVIVSFQNIFIKN